MVTITDKSYTKLKLPSGKDVEIRCKITFSARRQYGESLTNKTAKEAYLDMLSILLADSKELMALNSRDLTFIGEFLINQDQVLLKFYLQADHQLDFYERYRLSDKLYLSHWLMIMAKSVNETINSRIQEWSDSADFMKNIFLKCSNTLGNINNIFTKTLKSVDWVYFKNNLTLADRFTMLSVELGWGPSGYELCIDDWIEIVKIYDIQGEDEARKSIDELYITRYGKIEILKILESWRNNIILSDRIDILEQVVFSHIDKRFFVSTATLIPQIEGLLAKFSDFQGLLTGNKLKEITSYFFDDKKILHLMQHLKNIILKLYWLILYMEKKSLLF